MTNVFNLSDHKAFTCHCGSVNFALLQSGATECHQCRWHHPFEWREKPEAPAPDFVSVLSEAIRIAESKPQFKRVKGTPLENDIPVWMAVFALELLAKAAPKEKP